jgi:hypothetical protein
VRPSATTSGAGGGRWYSVWPELRRRHVRDGGVRRAEEVTVELPRAQRRRPDRNEPEPLTSGSARPTAVGAPRTARACTSVGRRPNGASRRVRARRPR